MDEVTHMDRKEERKVGQIEKYLKECHAIGRENVVLTDTIVKALAIGERTVVKRVLEERANGALICSTTSGHGGYYLPATIEEIETQKAILENGFKQRALAVRPFRRALAEYKAGKEVINGR